MDSTFTAFCALQPASTGYVACRPHYCDVTKAPKAKRRPALGACVTCRERKVKCDGNRPFCHRCVHRGIDCLYDLDVNERASEARKRRKEGIQRELLDLRLLYSSLRSCSENEALEILHRIRNSPSDTLPPEGFSGVTGLPAQPCSFPVLTDPSLPTREAGPGPFMEAPSFDPTGALVRYFDPAAALPIERIARDYTSTLNASAPISRDLMPPRTSIGFILQASSEDAPARRRSKFETYDLPSTEELERAANLRSELVAPRQRW